MLTALLMTGRGHSGLYGHWAAGMTKKLNSINIKQIHCHYSVEILVKTTCFDFIFMEKNSRNYNCDKVDIICY